MDSLVEAEYDRQFQQETKTGGLYPGGDRGHFVTKCGQARCIVMVNTF